MTKSISWQYTPMVISEVFFSKGENKEKIVDLLSREALSFDELTEELGGGANVVGAKITFLLVSGKITELEGKYYVN